MVLQRLLRLWVYGGFLAGILLLALTPLLAQGWSPALTAVWLLLPIYMLHQFEEHDNDRFRAFVNQHIGHGREALTLPLVFIVNVPGVWGVIALATYLAAWVRPGLGLIASYLVLVNILAHIGSAVQLRRYNPGLYTALTLFPLFGGWSVIALNREGASFGDHLIGLVVAVAIHAAIVVTVKRRLATLGG